ncbi:MAG: hypothetical protein M5R36_25170 [Deltaproteobacteria bacterium]|nr:hypothetical protein [Deltaproteobacteria bacterium]
MKAALRGGAFFAVLLLVAGIASADGSTDARNLLNGQSAAVSREQAHAAALARLAYEEELAELGIEPEAMTPADRDLLMQTRRARALELKGIKTELVELDFAAAILQDYLGADTYVAESAPNTNYNTADFARIGRHDTGWDNFFGQFYACPSGTVVAAEFWADITDNQLTGTLDATVANLSTFWFWTTITWNNKPSAAAPLTDITPVLTTDTGYTALTATNTVKAVCNVGNTNWGLTAYQESSDELGYVDVATAELDPDGPKVYVLIYYVDDNDSCSGAQNITVPNSVSGTTSGNFDDYAGTCGGDAEDVVYTFTGTVGMQYNVDLIGGSGAGRRALRPPGKLRRNGDRLQRRLRRVRVRGSRVLRVRRRGDDHLLCLRRRQFGRGRRFPTDHHVVDDDHDDHEHHNDHELDDDHPADHNLDDQHHGRRG